MYPERWRWLGRLCGIDGRERDTGAPGVSVRLGRCQERVGLAHAMSNFRRVRATASRNAWAQSDGQLSALRVSETSQFAAASVTCTSVNSGAKSRHPRRIFASVTIIAWISTSGRFGFGTSAL
jgi:hypothetical protein